MVSKLKRYVSIFLVTSLFFLILHSSSPSFLPVLAADTVIPLWVWKIYDYWDKKMITDLEFTNAIQYLEDLEIVRLIMPREYDANLISVVCYSIAF